MRALYDSKSKSIDDIHVVFGPHVEFVKHAVDDTIKQLA